jgi:hypothetical protein
VAWPEDVVLTIVDEDADAKLYEASPGNALNPESLPALMDSLTAWTQESEASLVRVDLDIWDTGYGKEIVGRALPLADRYSHRVRIGFSKAIRLINELERAGWRRQFLNPGLTVSQEAITGLFRGSRRKHWAFAKLNKPD